MEEKKLIRIALVAASEAALAQGLNLATVRIVIYRAEQKALAPQNCLERQSTEGDTPVFGGAKPYALFLRVGLHGIAALNGR